MKKFIHLKHPEFITIKRNRKNKVLKQIIQNVFIEITIDNEWDLPMKLFVSMPAQLDAVRLVHSK